jgi:hypothetical protein
LNRIYKKMLAVLKWQMFQSLTELGVANIFFKSSNVEDAQTPKESLQKADVVGYVQKAVILELSMQLYPTQLGLRKIKQAKLWKKYHPLVPEEYGDECCPKPTKAILDAEKNRKNAESKLKSDEKKKKEEKLKLSALSP